jgi:hypothetical protein
MARAETPWIGLLALIAMFVIPLLPAWLFEGPRTVKHRPHRHICNECGERWVRGHVCASDVDLANVSLLRGELRRLDGGSNLDGRATTGKELTAKRARRSNNPNAK